MVGPMPKAIVVSSCLLGAECRYDGTSCKDQALVEKLKGCSIVSVCPEELGGLSTPRPRARIVGDYATADGRSVLAGTARVLNSDGSDVTEAYLDGGRRALELAQDAGAETAVMKSCSPSCGCGQIFTDDFSAKKNGDGTTAALLKKNGIKVYTELDFPGVGKI